MPAALPSSTTPGAVRRTVADALSTQAMAKVADLVAGLDRDSRSREITNAFVAVPGWLERDG
jgi:hypothetical protein